MRPGTVKTDDQAFEQIRDRLIGEVGQAIQLVTAAKERGEYKGAPFWSMARMTFPVAESLGDLIYQENSSINLRSILAGELDEVRPGCYKPIAATLAVMYRHSLTHHDEQRMLATGGKEIDWYFGFNVRDQHLKIDKLGPGVFQIRFDTTAFYDDLVEVCTRAIGRFKDGRIRDRYNSWLRLDLDSARQTQAMRDAITEINAL